MGGMFRVSWNPERVVLGNLVSSSNAVSRFRSRFADFVWDAAALEGNSYTPVEVQALLADGIVAAGREPWEADQIIALSEGMEAMLSRVEDGSFRLDKSVSDEIHGLVARHEAIEAGHFRGEGIVHGGGAVRLADGSTVVEGDPSGDGGETLMDDYENLIVATEGMGDARERAFAYFASATRSQFYFDGNKRTARIMMAGELLSNGFEAVNVPYARAQEFNTALDELFRSDDATELFVFLSTCAPER